MALPATEAFGAAQAALPNPPWTQQRTTFVMATSGGGSGVSNATDTVGGFAFWNQDAFAADQYSQVTIKGGLSSTADFAMVTVRATGSGDAAFNCYSFYTDGVSGAGHCEIAKWTAGVKTVLLNMGVTFAANDVMKLSVSGTTLTAYKNGASIGSITDSSFASGSAGIGIQNPSSGVVTIDDWTGDNFSGGGGALSSVVQPGRVIYVNG